MYLHQANSKAVALSTPRGRSAKDHSTAGPVRLPGGGGFDLNTSLTYSSFLLVSDLGLELES